MVKASSGTCSLPLDPASEASYEVKCRVRTISRLQVREKVSDRGIGRWREYESQLVPMIAALAESGALDTWA